MSLLRLWRGGQSTANDDSSPASVQVATVDLDAHRAPHPAVILFPKDALAIFLRVVAYCLIALILAAALAGCAVYEHRDGGGYTVRYASVYDWEDRPQYIAHPAPRPRKVVIVKEAGESHPVLNLGQDDEIPREYRHYVSDRSLRTMRARHKMCAEARPGYCNAPNIPHCHGPYCHAHQGGDKRHTH